MATDIVKIINAAGFVAPPVLTVLAGLKWYFKTKDGTSTRTLFIAVAGTLSAIYYSFLEWTDPSPGLIFTNIGWYLLLCVLAVAIYYGLWAAYHGVAVRWWILPVGLVSYVGLYSALAIFCAAVLARNNYQLIGGDVSADSKPLSGATLVLQDSKSPRPTLLRQVSSDSRGKFLFTLRKDTPAADRPATVVSDGYCGEIPLDGHSNVHLKLSLHKCYLVSVSVSPPCQACGEFEVLISYFYARGNTAAFDHANVPADGKEFEDTISPRPGTTNIYVTFTSPNPPPGYNISLSEKELTLIDGLFLGSIAWVPADKDREKFVKENLEKTQDPSHGAEATDAALIVRATANTSQQLLESTSIYRDIISREDSSLRERRQACRAWFHTLDQAAEKEGATIDPTTKVRFTSLPEGSAIPKQLDELIAKIETVDPEFKNEKTRIYSQTGNKPSVAAREDLVKRELIKWRRHPPPPAHG